MVKGDKHKVQHKGKNNSASGNYPHQYVGKRQQMSADIRSTSVRCVNKLVISKSCVKMLQNNNVSQEDPDSDQEDYHWKC